MRVGTRFARRACQLLLAALLPFSGAATADAQIVRTVTRLLPPGNVAVAPQPGGVLVRWDGVAGAAGYAVERAAPDANFTLLRTVSAAATVHIDSTVIPGATYQYRVTAIGETGLRVASSAVLVTVPFSAPTTIGVLEQSRTRLAPADAPQGSAPAPLGVYGQPGSVGTVDVFWGCVADAARYEVYATPQGGATARVGSAPAQCETVPDAALLTAVQQARSEGGLPVLQPPPPGSSSVQSVTRGRLTHSGAPTGRQVSYVVRAVYADGRAGDSPPVAVFVPFIAPSALEAQVLSADAVRLTWKAVPGAQGYRITRSAPSVREAEMPLTSSCVLQTSHTDRGLVRQQYVYRVAACPHGFEANVSVMPEAREVMVRRAYDDGAARHPAPAAHFTSRALWERAALASSASYDQLVRSWEAVATAALAYEHTLKRAPTGAELNRYMLEHPTRHWTDLWRELATSAERDRRYRHFAPAPMTPAQAKVQYSLRYEREGDQCFGGLGIQCAGEIPLVVDIASFLFNVALPEPLRAAWTRDFLTPQKRDGFTMPDGTRMVYFETAVAVGSILHDNACVDADPGTGVACNGYDVGQDAGKVRSDPAAHEWAKAFWNVVDGKHWRVVFGPYPEDSLLRRSWYDDLRPEPARPAKMASVAAFVTSPVQTEPYTGRERRMTRQLAAPSGTRLDVTDAAFCASGTFSGTGVAPNLLLNPISPYGACR